MIAKRIAFLLACAVVWCAHADAFFWLNNVDNRWLPFETLSNWNVGTSATGKVPTRHPGENDTIDYGSRSGNYIYLYFDLGGHAHTIAGLTNQTADWYNHYLGISNGTLTVTGDYQPRAFVTTIAKDGRLNIHGASTSSLWGGSGIMCPYTVKAGGYLEMGGAYSIYGSSIEIEAGGTADFAVSQLGWVGYSDYRNGITNNGTLTIPNGFTVTTPPMSELWNTTSGGYRHPTFGITQAGGTIVLGGDITRIRKCDEGYCPVDFTIRGGTVVFDCTPAFSGVDPVLGNGIATTLSVTEGNTVDLKLFKGGSGSQVTKTGAGYLRSIPEAPYVLIVSEGGYVTSSAANPFPESVTLEDGVTVVFGVPGTTLTMSAFPGFENYVYDIDPKGIPDGGTILSTPDVSLRNGVFSRLKTRPGVTYKIDGMRITYTARKTATTSYWTGAAGDGKWTTPGNWIGDVPGEQSNGGFPDDQAVFSDGASYDQTIDLAGLVCISNVFVRGSAAPSYTFGTSGDQVLRLAAGGSFVIESDVERMPVMAATLGFKSKATSSEGIYFVRNETAREFVLNDIGSVLCTWTGANVDSLRLSGTGTIRLAGRYRDGGSHSFDLYENLTYAEGTDTGRLVIDADQDVHYFVVGGGANATDLHKVEISSGRTLWLNGGTATLANIGRNTLFTGAGTLQLSSGLKSGNYVNGAVQVSANCTMTVDCKLKSACVTEVTGTFKSGAQFTSTGTVILPTDNEIEGNVEALGGVRVSASSIGFENTQSALGRGSRVSVGSTGGLVYTGPGETAGRSVVLASGEGRVFQGGTGVLTMSSSPVSDVSSTTLSLNNLPGSDGNWYDGVWAAAIKNNSKALNLLKAGPGRWILTGANTFTGSTTVDTGTLRLSNAGTLASSSGVTLQNNGTLELDATGAETLKKLTVGAGENRIVLTGDAKLTISSIARGTGDGSLEIETASAANTVVISGKTSTSDRLNWIRINGRAVGFDDTGKVIASLLKLDVEIAARGGVIPNASTKNVGITTVGTSGHVTLQGAASATVKALAQEASALAQVEIPSGQRLTTGGLYAAADAQPLVIGGFASDGTLYSSATEFTLYPEGPDSEISIRSPFGFTTSTILHQYGKGLSRLSASAAATWAGTAQIDSGTFAISNTTSIAATLKGPGRFKLEGSNTRTLSKVQTSFNGDFVLGGGVTKPSVNTALGAINNSTLLPQIVVEKGAALDLTGGMPTATKTVDFSFRGFRISGTGPDGKGAIVSTVGAKTTHAHSLSLDGDATLGEINQTGGSCYIHFRNPSFAYNSLSDFGGHTLTHPANGFFSFTYNTITNAGEIILGGVAGEAKSGMILYDNVELGGPSDPPITMRNGSAIYMGTGFTPGSAPFMRRLVVEGTNVLVSSWAAGCNTNRNCWAGPVELKNATSLMKSTPSNPSNDLQVAFHGQISGPGSVWFGQRGRVFLTHPHNTYTGTTTVYGTQGGSVHFDWPGSVPDYAKTLVPSGHATVYAEGGDGAHWRRADILSLANKASLTQVNSSYPFGSIAIDATGCRDQTFNLTLADSDMTNPTFGLGVDGGNVVLDGDFTHIHHLFANRGRLAISGERVRTINEVSHATSEGPHEMGVISFEGGSTTIVGKSILVGQQNWLLNCLGKVAVGNATLLSATLNETNAPTFVHLGYRDNSGILEINDGAVVSNGVVLCQNSTNGGRGAIHMRGGSFTAWGIVTAPTLMAATGNSYGYVGIEGGDYVQSGPWHFGAAAVASTNCQAVLCQSGGTFRYTTRKLGTDLSDYSLRLGGPNGTAVTIYRTGGDFYAERSVMLANPGPDAQNVFAGGTANWIQGENAGTAEIEKSLVLAGANSSVANLTLNGGTLIANKFFKAGGKTSNKAYVNFNGGTLLSKSSNPIFGTMTDEASTLIDQLTVYAGGAHVGAVKGVTTTLGAVLRKATGNGIASIAAPDWETIVPTNSCGRMVGPPTVTITDSTGFGATAVVEFDRERLMPGKIVVTSPGCGYTKPTVVVAYGKDKWTCVATLAANAPDGGFAAEGEGTIVLDKPNDYAGPTTVNGGTLRPSTPTAIPSSSQIVLNGGVFDINGMSIGASRITFNPGGGLQNSGGVIPVHASFTADMQAIREGKSFNYYGDVAFAPDTTVTIVNASVEDFSTSAPSSYTLFHITGTATGVENLTANVEGLADETANWKITHAGEDVKLRCSRGNFIIMH